MIDSTDTGLLRAIRDCDSMQIRCTGKDGVVVTIDFKSGKRSNKGFFKDIAYAVEEFLNRAYQ